jgi:phosphoglycolate phosphatase
MKLVLLDCDGTLVDSQNGICEAMAYAFAGHGLVAPSRADAGHRRAVVAGGVRGAGAGATRQCVPPAERYRKAFSSSTRSALQALFKGGGTQ